MDFLHTLEHHLLNHSMSGPITLLGIEFTFSKHMMMMFIAAGILIVIFSILCRSWPLIPSGSKNFIEIFVIFIRDEIMMPNMGKEGLRYLPYFLTLFFFILTVNLIGLVPGSATATGNISVTAALALCSFGLINYAGIKQFGFVHHVKNFIPHGLPVWLIPLMLPLEILGLFTKAFALCIRLFANMFAGHIVLLAFLSLSFLLGSLIVSVGSIPIALGIYMLETFVCFLQAYIFTFLTAIFVGASLHPH